MTVFFLWSRGLQKGSTLELELFTLKEKKVKTGLEWMNIYLWMLSLQICPKESWWKSPPSCNSNHISANNIRPLQPRCWLATYGARKLLCCFGPTSVLERPCAPALGWDSFTLPAPPPRKRSCFELIESYLLLPLYPTLSPALAHLSSIADMVQESFLPHSAMESFLLPVYQ